MSEHYEDVIVMQGTPAPIGTKQVLDHGYVKFIGSMGSDETIIEAARMSTGKGFQDWEHDAKLLKYLYSHGHMTPFEMCELSIEVQAPIFVAREWMRSRTQSYNELSARYVQMPDVHYVPTAERMVKQSTHNKQAGSSDALPYYMACMVRDDMQADQKDLYHGYEEYLGIGLAREVARINTPVSRYTRFRAKTDLRNWLGFINLRLRDNAQEEIRVYAQVIADMIKVLWPRTWALFEEYDLYGKRLSRTEYQEYLRLKAAPEYKKEEDAPLVALRDFWTGT